MPVLEKNKIIEISRVNSPHRKFTKIPDGYYWDSINKVVTNVKPKKPFKGFYFKKETEMTFPTDIIRANSIVNCRQCAGCHGCR